MLTSSDFTYDLPERLIAHQPPAERDQCRLLVADRRTHQWRHHFFYELPTILDGLQEQLVIVRNNSRVIPARLYGQKTTGGHVEILLSRSLSTTTTTQEWACLTKPGLKVGQVVTFPGSPVTAHCLGNDADYTRRLAFTATPATWATFLDQVGRTPLPPYIHSSATEADRRRTYQTVYATTAGSVAAPTAGLHFTALLTQELIARGFEFVDVTLHVGLGTFLGVKTDNLADHHMHREEYFISPQALTRLQQAVRHHQRLLAIGTTSARVLESVYSRIFCENSPNSSNYSRTNCGYNSNPAGLHGDTDIFLYPPAQFHLVDHLLTNFHLPQSTLLMLISAFATTPNTPDPFTTWSQSWLGQVYQEAIAHDYRFFSFGDAMLIL